MKDKVQIRISTPTSEILLVVIAYVAVSALILAIPITLLVLWLA